MPVTALKSYFGNLGAGTGAVEIVGTLAAFETGQVPYTLNYEQPDPSLPGERRSRFSAGRAAKAALLLNQTSMGQSVAMVLCGPTKRPYLTTASGPHAVRRVAAHLTVG